MMRSRRIVPPNGWWYWQKETNWPAVPFAEFGGATFEQAVEKIIKHRLANPRFNLATDFDTVAQELDAFTSARLITVRGADQWIVGGAAAKKSAGLSNSPSATDPSTNAAGVGKWARNTVAGVGLYAEWFGDGGEPVSKDVAEARAAVCVQCPHNNTHVGIKEWFCDQAAKEIMQVMEILKGLDLHLDNQDKLGICVPCSCPLRAKAWAPLGIIVKHLRPEAKAGLWEKCWITQENKP